MSKRPATSPPNPLSRRAPPDTDLGENRDDDSVYTHSRLDSLGELKSSRSQRPPPSVRMADEGAGITDNPGMTTTKVDTTLTFDGKATDLPGLWFQVDMKALLDATLSTPERKCAYVASLFRGHALEWLARIYANQPSVLADYDTFRDLINTTWGQTPETLRLVQERELIRLKARIGGVHDFTAQFESLTSALALEDATKTLLYSSKLPIEIQDRVMVGADTLKYVELRDNARQVDEQLKAIQAPARSPEVSDTPRRGKKSRKAKRGGAPAIKAEVAMISVRGHVPFAVPERSDVFTIGGREAVCLLDSGSAVNCVPFRPADQSWKTYPSRVTLVGPTGETLQANGEYFVDTIDGIPQQFYVIPGLAREGILGRPYLDKVRPLDVFAVETTGEIEDGGRLRPHSAPEREALDAFLKEARENDWIRPSLASAAANILFVPKKSGKLRPCMDYRKLNGVTVKDRYALPLIWDILDRARQGHFFCVLDCKAAFHRLRVRPGDEYKLAFKTLAGTYEWLVMPFGVTNGPAYQQRFMDFVLKGHEAYAACYIDDIVIWGEDESQTLARVEWVRESLRALDVQVNNDKTQPPSESVIYLGMTLAHHRVNANMDEDLVKSWPTPLSKTELQSFLGLANWFGPFAYGLSEGANLLYGLTGNAEFCWDTRMDQAFQDVKEALLQHMTIFSFAREEKLQIYTDASGFATGGIAFQGDRPVGVTGKTLDEHQRNYTTTERELLAVVRAVKKWRPLIESCLVLVEVYTDHKAITQDLNTSHENRRMNRWALLLAEYQIKYIYVKGKDNPADIPSRRADWSKGVLQGGRRGGGPDI